MGPYGLVPAQFGAERRDKSSLWSTAPGAAVSLLQCPPYVPLSSQPCRAPAKGTDATSLLLVGNVSIPGSGWSWELSLQPPGHSHPPHVNHITRVPGC